VHEGDLVRVITEPATLRASVDLVGSGREEWGAEEGSRVLAERASDPRLAPDPNLPADTALWARLQSVSGGLWGGCVYDADAIIALLGAAGAAEHESVSLA
jgi:xylonate dehydratase